MEAIATVHHERPMLNTKAHRYAYQRASIRLATSLCMGGLLHVHRTGSHPMKRGEGTRCKCPGSETHRRVPRLVSEISPVACASFSTSPHRLNRKPHEPIQESTAWRLRDNPASRWLGHDIGRRLSHRVHISGREGLLLRLQGGERLARRRIVVLRALLYRVARSVTDAYAMRRRPAFRVPRMQQIRIDAVALVPPANKDSDDAPYDEG